MVLHLIPGDKNNPRVRLPEITVQEPGRHSPQGQWVCARPPPTPCLDISILACPPVRNLRIMASSATTRDIDNPSLSAQKPETRSWRNLRPISAMINVRWLLSHRRWRLSKHFFALLHHAIADGHGEGSRVWRSEGIRPRGGSGPCSALDIAAGERGPASKIAFSCNKVCFPGV